MTRKRVLWAVFWLWVITTAIAVWGYALPWTRIGTGYAAKQVCSCVHVGSRELSSCLADLDLWILQAEPLASHTGIRAFVPLIAEASAIYYPGTGCTQQ